MINKKKLIYIIAILVSLIITALLLIYLFREKPVNILTINSTGGIPLKADAAYEEWSKIPNLENLRKTANKDMGGEIIELNLFNYGSEKFAKVGIIFIEDSFEERKTFYYKFKDSYWQPATKKEESLFNNFFN